MANYDAIKKDILDGDEIGVVEKIQAALNDGVPAIELINEALMPGINEVGRLFADGELFVPEVMVAAYAMSEGMNLVKPFIIGEDMGGNGKIVIGTVKGDLHDIGKNLVVMMLEASGFSVINLGTDVADSAFVEAVREHKPNIVGMSAMLTSTMLNMKNVIELLKKEGLYDGVQVIVGGAPVSKNFAAQIGASYAVDAVGAADLCKSLLCIA